MAFYYLGWGVPTNEGLGRAPKSKTFQLAATAKSVNSFLMSEASNLLSMNKTFKKARGRTPRYMDNLIYVKTSSKKME